MPDGDALPPLRVLFVAPGSRGDVEPLLAVAQQLVAQGHRCVAAASRPPRARSERLCLFASLAPTAARRLTRPPPQRVRRRAPSVRSRCRRLRLLVRRRARRGGGDARPLLRRLLLPHPPTFVTPRPLARRRAAVAPVRAA